MYLRPNPAGSSSGAAEIVAWTLNVSRGGLRLIVEDEVAVGASYSVSIGDESPRLATVVWTREEADGQIAGMRFEAVDGVDASTPAPSAS